MNVHATFLISSQLVFEAEAVRTGNGHEWVLLAEKATAYGLLREAAKAGRELTAPQITLDSVRKRVADCPSLLYIHSGPFHRSYAWVTPPGNALCPPRSKPVPHSACLLQGFA